MLAGWDDDTEHEDEGELDKSQTFAAEGVLEIALERSAQHPLKLWIERLECLYWLMVFTTKLRQVSFRIEEIYLAGDIDPFYLPGSPSFGFDRLCRSDISSLEELAAESVKHLENEMEGFTETRHSILKPDSFVAVDIHGLFQLDLRNLISINRYASHTADRAGNVPPSLFGFSSN
ncbi:hypothetical protein C8J56DRAFT_891013 [Mycena floridula]|nr:hypothetical protein C8J56DRAFT_891013 [Mycena floridula]